MKVCDKFCSKSSLDLGRSVVHTNFSKIFISETAWPIKVNFYVEHPWVGPIIVCSNDDLEVFYGKVNFGKIGFYMGKSANY